MEQKSVQLNKKNTVKIIPTYPKVDLDSDLYAINWFDLKRPWLYDFYNQMAYPHVQEVGGQVHFKGRVTKKIKGPDEVDRQMLLIVKYPNADQFLKMISNKMFLYKSVLRLKAVDYFTFGFTKRHDSGPLPLEFPKVYEGGLSYLLYQFKAHGPQSDSLYALEQLVISLDMHVHFSGTKAALIGRSSSEAPLRTQPFLMDGLALIGSDDEERFRELINHSSFLELSSQNLSSSLYYLSRTL